MKRPLFTVIALAIGAAALFTPLAAEALVQAGDPDCLQALRPRGWKVVDNRTLIVTDHFRNQLGASASASILNEIRRFELFTDGRSAQIALSKPDLIIERSKLIPALAKEAQQAGAQVSFDSRFVSLSPNSRGLHLEVESAGRRELILDLLRGHGEPPKLFDSFAAFQASSLKLGITVSPAVSGLNLQSPAQQILTESQLFGDRARQEHDVGNARPVSPSTR